MLLGTLVTRGGVYNPFILCFSLLAGLVQFPVPSFSPGLGNGPCPADGSYLCPFSVSSISGGLSHHTVSREALCANLYICSPGFPESSCWLCWLRISCVFGEHSSAGMGRLSKHFPSPLSDLDGTLAALSPGLWFGVADVFGMELAFVCVHP